MRVKKCNKQHKKKIKKKQKKVKINSALVDKTKVVLSGSHISPELEHPRCSFSSEEECEAKNECGLALRHVCEEENKVKNECESAPRDVANSDVGEEESVVKRKCGAAPRDVGFQSVPISQGATYNDSSCVELHGHVYAQPIINPIWRGSMYFCNETVGTVCGLLAHMSDVACSRVLEEAGHFPEMLHVELLPRSMVWPESFKGGEPTDQDIALFFFPDSEGAEKVFDALVDDIISHEHAIRFVAKNAELLIFPSTELPISYWRFEAKYYLWGVFKRKQTSKETNDAVCRD